jgi:phosphorylcholine metabolism protein LicD
MDIFCKICYLQYEKQDDLIQHLYKTDCCERYLQEKLFEKDDLYYNIGMYNIINIYFSENAGYGIYKNVALELLKQVLEILDEFNINYMAISGTLLGIVRHNDLLPWDDDLDLLVDKKILTYINSIYEKYKDKLHFIIQGTLIKICFLDKCFPIQHENIKKYSIGDIERYNFPFIDLFIMEEQEDNLFFFNKIWNKEHFFPQQTYKLYSLNIKIPQNPKYFLDRNYGETWNTILISNKWCHKYERRYQKSFKITIDEYKKFSINNKLFLL